ncbi:MAG: cysteine desulfurase-like protein [Planctomycetota bacterium]
MPQSASEVMPVSIDAIRAKFPALRGSTVILENAGGSQVPQGVADAVHRYMTETYIQLGGEFKLSKTCGGVVRDAHTFINMLMNGTDVGHVILGASCTALVNMIAAAYADTIRPGDEVIIAELGHEANVGAWAKLEKAGAAIKTWTVDASTFGVSLDELESLLSDRTRIVAFPQVSNLFGEIVDVKAITELCHRYGARVMLDSVAYAPHRAMDVKAWGVDWCTYSTYKVYGPHMGAMFGTKEAFAELVGPNHFFIPNDELPRKFEPGGVSHEGCAGLLALAPYLNFLAGKPDDAPCDRATIGSAFDVMTALELPLQARLIDYLNARDDVRIIGPAHADASRVATISFVHDRVPSGSVARHAASKNVAIKHGHMYSYRLCQRLGLPLDDGVIRASMVHYNTLAEIDRLIEVLDEAFDL